MLSKRICKQCSVENHFEFSQLDEQLWEMGMFICPYNRVSNDVKVGFSRNPSIRVIPRKCKYRVEQIVVSGEEHVE
jgi:hypothetical protein